MNLDIQYCSITSTWLLCCCRCSPAHTVGALLFYRCSATAATALPPLHDWTLLCRRWWAHPPRMHAPSLPLLLCESQHPNPNLSYFADLRRRRPGRRTGSHSSPDWFLAAASLPRAGQQVPDWFLYSVFFYLLLVSSLEQDNSMPICLYLFCLSVSWKL